MDQPSSLTDNLFFLSGVMTNRLSYRIKRSFRNAGIDVTTEQFSILALLWYKEGYNQQEIANILQRDKTTITRVLDKMFSKNLLVRVPDPNDSRSKLIYLTRSGKDLQAQCVDITGKEYARVMQGIPERESRQVVEVLKKIIANL